MNKKLISLMLVLGVLSPACAAPPTQQDLLNQVSAIDSTLDALKLKVDRIAQIVEALRAKIQSEPLSIDSGS